MENYIKLFFECLIIDVTRKCNLKCAHCFAGDAQNVSISKRVIDIVLSQLEGVGLLVLSGGEPFLEPDIVEYIVDQIIEKKIYIPIFEVITNGTIQDVRCALAMRKMAEYTYKFGGTCAVYVSDDKWHKESPLYDAEKTVQFYKSICGDKARVEIKPEDILPEKHSYVYSGRAVNLPVSDEYGIRFENGFHRIGIDKFLDNYNALSIQCYMEITVDGKLKLGSMVSYELCDKMELHTVEEYSLYNLIRMWNKEHPLSCQESKEYIINPLNDFHAGVITKEEYNKKIESVGYLIELRKTLLELNPDMTFAQCQEATKTMIGLSPSQCKIQQMVILIAHGGLFKTTEELVAQIKEDKVIANNYKSAMQYLDIYGY